MIIPGGPNNIYFENMKTIIFILSSLVYISRSTKNKSENIMDVKLYYFDGCPTYIETTENLKQALNELNLKYNFFGCRIYTINGRITGTPSKDF